MKAKYGERDLIGQTKGDVLGASLFDIAGGIDRVLPDGKARAVLGNDQGETRRTLGIRTGIEQPDGQTTLKENPIFELSQTLGRGYVQIAQAMRGEHLRAHAAIRRFDFENVRRGERRGNNVRRWTSRARLVDRRR